MISQRSVQTETPVAQLESELAETIPIRRPRRLSRRPRRPHITGQSINVDGGLVMH